MALFKMLHLLAALVWVGGMFFAYAVLRPTAAEVLQPPERLRLWDGVFRRFFNWVWLSIGLLLVTGFYMIYQYGGIAYAPRHVHIMLALGLAMITVYGYVFFSCFVPLSVNVSKQCWKEAGEQLGRIRKLVAVNLALGLLTVSVAALGAAGVFA